MAAFLAMPIKFTTQVIKSKWSRIYGVICTSLGMPAPCLGILMQTGAKPLSKHGLRDIHQIDIFRENPNGF